MKQSKGLRISALLFVALLAVAAFSGAASANQEDLPEHAIIGPNNLDEGIPDFGPEVFEEIKQDQNVIGTYGKIPLFETAKQREDWLNTLDEAAKNVRSDVLSYFYPQGPVIAYGYNYQGYLEVDLKEGLDVEKPEIDKIYEIFNQQGIQMHVHEVPMVFRFESLPKLDGRSSYWRPVIGGIQVQAEKSSGTYSATLGFAAEDSGGTKGYVVAGHFGDSTGLQIWQPYTSWWQLWYKAGKVNAIGGTYADASWVPYSNVEATIYITDDDITGPVKSYTDPVVGWYVYKSGITTGLTYGQVKGKRTAMSHPTFGTLYDQYYATYSSAGGDSGSPVYHIDSGDREIVGIHWGSTSSYTYFSPVSGVQTDLGVDPLTR